MVGWSRAAGGLPRWKRASAASFFRDTPEELRGGTMGLFRLVDGKYV